MYRRPLEGRYLVQYENVRIQLKYGLSVNPLYSMNSILRRFLTYNQR